MQVKIPVSHVLLDKKALGDPSTPKGFCGGSDAAVRCAGGALLNLFELAGCSSGAFVCGGLLHPVRNTLRAHLYEALLWRGYARALFLLSLSP